MKKIAQIFKNKEIVNRIFFTLMILLVLRIGAAITVPGVSTNGSLSDALNSANKRLIRRFSEIDSSGNFTAAVYLIAQIGKNFALPEEDQIEGSELLMAAMNVFCETKKAIGGKLVMVERESDRPKLLEFYNDNGFKSWTTRRNAKDGMVYDQMFAVLGGK